MPPDLIPFKNKEKTRTRPDQDGIFVKANFVKANGRPWPIMMRMAPSPRHGDAFRIATAAAGFQPPETGQTCPLRTQGRPAGRKENAIPLSMVAIRGMALEGRPSALPERRQSAKIMG